MPFNECVGQCTQRYKNVNYTVLVYNYLKLVSKFTY